MSFEERSLAAERDAARTEVNRLRDCLRSEMHALEAACAREEALKRRVAALESELTTLRASVVDAMSSAGPEVAEDERAP